MSEENIEKIKSLLIQDIITKLPCGYKRYEADSYWQINVDTNQVVMAEGYAEEAGLDGKKLSDLSIIELSYLALHNEPQPVKKSKSKI